MSEQLIRALERHALVPFGKDIFKCRCGQWSFSSKADEIKRSRSHAEHIAEQLDQEAFDATSGSIRLPNELTKGRPPVLVKGCEGYKCVCCEEPSGPLHLRIGWMYTPLCTDCLAELGESLPATMTDKPAAPQPSLERDARRYWRLRVLGAALCESRELREGNVLRFTNLDEAVDEDIRINPSRGEAELYFAQPERLAAPPTEPKQTLTLDEDFNRCSRCDAKAITVRVDTGFSGEFEFLCGPCVSAERLQDEPAPPPLAAFRALAFPDDRTSSFTFGEGVASKVQKMLSDKYTNSYLIVAGIIDQELRALIAEAEKGKGTT